LEKGFITFPKPPIYLPHRDISLVTFSRVGSVGKTFEITISMGSSVGKGGEWGFSSIPREEYQPLMTYCKNHKIHVENEMTESAPAPSYREFQGDLSGYGIESDVDDSDVGESRKRRRSDGAAAGGDTIGGVMGDSESEDEDFVGSSASSEAASSSSDEEAEEGSDKSDTEIKKPSPPKKKKKSTSAASSPKTSNTTKKKKDPNAPKRPMTSFLYFSQAKRPELAIEQPGLSLPETSRAIGALWKEVGADEKEIYEKMAKEDKVRYLNQMKNYTPPVDDGSVVVVKKKKPSLPCLF
jgi:structure-specific recognition protein 1